VPEIAVNEYNNSYSVEHEIGFARQFAASTPACDLVAPHYANQPEFGRPVASTPYKPHNFGSSLGGETVSHSTPSQFVILVYRFTILAFLRHITSLQHTSLLLFQKRNDLLRFHAVKDAYTAAQVHGFG
jgi:hypothetical protein